jgi:deoxyribodipyrimidine photo-lyase
LNQHTSSSGPVNIFWFRRDLRLEDNAGLYHALKHGLPVIPVFIFDRNILDELNDQRDRRVSFIHQAITTLSHQLNAVGSSLLVYHGYPEAVFENLLLQFNITAVFTNHDYEPYAIQRDERIKTLLERNGRTFHSYKDQVIFEKSEIMKNDGSAYTVFTPYATRWRSLLAIEKPPDYSAPTLFGNFIKADPLPVPSLESMNFFTAQITFPVNDAEENLLLQYARDRNFPGINGTSRLGVHLRFGTISVRQLVKKALSLSAVYLNELIWREFYQMILWNFPAVGKGLAFKPAYDRIPWRNDESDFEKWKEGKTGYALVDAGMRELSATGFMHNRVRMVVASFLTKHLLIDWRWGEAWFAEHLLDYELASNNGGWQWASGSGCDAAPYFRIFNPDLQAKKFDPQAAYIRKWVPEFESPDYRPMIDHAFARKRSIETYAKALQKQ